MENQARRGVVWMDSLHLYRPFLILVFSLPFKFAIFSNLSITVMNELEQYVRQVKRNDDTNEAIWVKDDSLNCFLERRKQDNNLDTSFCVSRSQTYPTSQLTFSASKHSIGNRKLIKCSISDWYLLFYQHNRTSDQSEILYHLFKTSSKHVYFCRSHLCDY